MKTLQGTRRTPAGQWAAHRDAGGRLRKYSRTTHCCAGIDRGTARRGSGRRYPLRAHRVYGAGAMKPMLKCGLLNQSSSSFFPLPLPLPLGNLRTSEPIGARSASISKGGPCDRASSKAATASFHATRAARCGRIRTRYLSCFCFLVRSHPQSGHEKRYRASRPSSLSRGGPVLTMDSGCGSGGKFAERAASSKSARDA